jgi:aspartate aminotransferase
MLLYDQVYWRLTYGDYEHFTPVGLVPEMFPYTVMVDAVSKWWAGTGLRVGWCVCPPWVRKTMQAFVGHMGAWPARAEQMSVARVLSQPELTVEYDQVFHGKLRQRLTALRDGLLAMRGDGLPVDALDAQGAIYLSARFDLIGRKTPGGEILTDEDIRSFLLHDAGVAIVPFTAFGYPEKTGWVRFSVGSVTMDNVASALKAIRQAVAGLS